MLLMLDKTAKFLRFIFGRDDFTAEKWAQLYLDLIYSDWGLPDTFVSDMDPKFMSALWQSMCKAGHIDVRTAAAYHHSAVGQIERSVQTFKLGLITIVGGLYNPDKWDDYVPHLVFYLNTSVSATTRQVPYELLYGRKAKSFLSPQTSLGDSFGEVQQQLRDDAWDAIHTAEAKMKIYYDRKHVKPPVVEKDDFVYVKLGKPGRDGYHLNNQTSLSFPRAGPFKVLDRIDDLTLRLQLPPHLRWNNRIAMVNTVPVRLTISIEICLCRNRFEWTV